ncbi:mitochondrial import inner membrane translocase subunit Tim8 [Procambarus clarkii]|uniref:mitochondrial import inner membrane translocase subunit Tim8 n=1 Tax=Procambarus clarkii TaxID=6728 RepID=UPI001E6746E2|nr:mitochondrial import inner membrane translocase subunit Tim8-like [Procambarus clarkii]
MGWFFGDGSSESTSESPSTAPFDSNFSSSSSDSGFSSSFDSGSSNFGDSFSSPGAGFDSGSGGSIGGGKDAELQSFLMLEQQKAQMQSMIHKMNDICWETCVGAPGSKLDSRTETCISNCVDRFIDSTLFITNRFAQLLSKSGAM